MVKSNLAAGHWHSLTFATEWMHHRTVRFASVAVLLWVPLIASLSTHSARAQTLDDARAQRKTEVEGLADDYGMLFDDALQEFWADEGPGVQFSQRQSLG